MNLDDIDGGFKESLIHSVPSVERAAEWIRRRNERLDVFVKPLVIRPDPSLRHLYSDQCDIIATHKDTGRKWNIEVKQALKLSFTCLDDFPYNSLLVNTGHKVDRFKADFYFRVDQDMSHAAIIRGDTRPTWWRELPASPKSMKRAEREGRRIEPGWFACLWQARWIDLGA